MQADGMPITYWHALVRNVLRIADFLPLFYGAGALVALLGHDNRRIGDLVAGTIVARERGDFGREQVLDIRVAVENFLNAGAAMERRTPNPPAARAPEHPAPEPVNEVDAETAALMARLDAQDYELVRDFMARRETLPSPARTRLAHSLARRTAAKLQIEEVSEGEAEAFLAEVAERLQGRM
jgi:hypothetical protein